MDKGTTGKAIATIVIWMMVVGAIALTGIFLAPEIGEDALGAIFMVLVAAVVTNGFIWDWGRGSRVSRRDLRKRQAMEDDIYDMAHNSLQKRKRDDIGSRLSDLSDDDLLDLRHRVQSGDVDEGEIAYLLRK